MASRVSETCGAVSRAFAALGLRWYLFGAQAVILHGARRNTADVDVTVDLGGRATTEIVAALGREGVVVRMPADEEFIRATRVLPMRHEATRMPVDVVLAGPGLEELFLSRTTLMAVGSLQIPVARLEDLVVMKILAARPQDLEDVARVLAVHSDADVSAIRSLLGEIEEGVGQSDLVPAFEDALARAARARKRI